MRKTLVIALSTLLTATLWTPAAFADHGWRFGSAFRIGDVHFQIGYHSDHRDRYYYRTRVDVGRHYYGRAHRSGGCYVRNGYHYHGQSCPLVHSYFRDHGYYHDAVFSRYAPDYGHRGYGSRYDQGYGYREDGYGRHRGRGYGHRGYGDHHRNRHRHHGHRHHGYCPYH